MTGRGRTARLLDEALVAEIESASLERRRRIAIAVARTAVAAVASGDSGLSSVAAALGRTGAGGGFPGAPDRDSVEAEARTLDERYLELHDDSKPGGRTPGWEEAFRVARAAAAAACVFEDDPTAAALEAAYEASHAMGGDTARLLEVVRGVR